MGKTDSRVRVPNTDIKIKHHRAMAAIARYLADGWKMETLDTIMDNARFKNGRIVRTALKSKQQLANVLRTHPHFDNIPLKITMRGMTTGPKRREVGHWFLADRQSYLLGAGHAYPSEFYTDPTGNPHNGPSKIRSD